MYNRLEDGPGQARAGINAPSPFSSLLLCRISYCLAASAFSLFGLVLPSFSLLYLAGQNKLHGNLGVEPIQQALRLRRSPGKLRTGRAARYQHALLHVDCLAEKERRHVCLAFPVLVLD